MTNRTYIRTSGFIFAIVSLLHLLRLLKGWDLVLDTWLIPEAFSALVVIITGTLGIHASKLTK